MTLDEIVLEIESDLGTVSLAAVKLALGQLIPSSIAFFLTPIGTFVWGYLLGPFVGWIVGIVIKQMDNAGYYTYKTIANNADASSYEDAIRASKDAVEKGDSNAIAQAKAAQRNAFIKLWCLTS